MNRAERISWLLTVLASAIILCGVFLAPLASSHGLLFSRFIYLLYSPLCHQQPDRSYFLSGQQLAVCSRCLGIYAGFLFGTLIYPFWSKTFRLRITSRPGLMILMVIPMILDVFFSWLKLWNSPLFLKTITGFTWSAVLPLFWFKALDELFAKLPKN